ARAVPVPRGREGAAVHGARPSALRGRPRVGPRPDAAGPAPVRGVRGHRIPRRVRRHSHPDPARLVRVHRRGRDPSIMSTDITETLAPKSDQQNFEDYALGNVRTVTVTRVEVTDGEQPVSVHLAEFPGRPYKPSKTMRRVMAKAWGP